MSSIAYLRKFKHILSFDCNNVRYLYTYILWRHPKENEFSIRYNILGVVTFALFTAMSSTIMNARLKMGIESIALEYQSCKSISSDAQVSRIFVCNTISWPIKVYKCLQTAMHFWLFRFKSMSSLSNSCWKCLQTSLLFSIWRQFC